MKTVLYETSDITWFVVIHTSHVWKGCNFMTKRSNNNIKWDILTFFFFYELTSHLMYSGKLNLPQSDDLV